MSWKMNSQDVPLKSISISVSSADAAAQALGDIRGRRAVDSGGCIERRPKFVDGKPDGVARTERGVEVHRLAIRLGVEDEAEHETFERRHVGDRDRLLNDGG